MGQFEYRAFELWSFYRFSNFAHSESDFFLGEIQKSVKKKIFFLILLPTVLNESIVAVKKKSAISIFELAAKKLSLTRPAS